MATAVRSMMVPSKRSLYLLVSTWVLMIPLLIFASEGGFSFEHGSKNTEIGARVGDSNDSTPVRIQSGIVYLICIIFIIQLSPTILIDLYRDLLFLSLPVLALLSIMWSQMPMKTLGHTLMLSANICFAFYLLRRFSTNDLLKLFLMVGSLAEIGSLLLVVFLPQFGLQARSAITSGSWQGIFPQKNICGIMMTELLLPAFFVQVESRLEKFLRISYILVALLIIAMSRSAGSWVICAACIVFVATIHLLIRMPRKDASAIVFFLIGFVIVAGVFVCSNFDTLMYAIGKDPTMTGRTLIWSNLMTSVKKQPLLGYGFMAFWGAEQGESINTALAMHWPGMGYAENGVLELWLELGAVGVFLFLLVFLRAVKDAIHCFLRDPSPAVMWYVSVLFFLTVCNIEAGLLLSTSDLGVIVSFVAFAGLRREAHEDYGAKLILSPS